MDGNVIEEFCVAGTPAPGSRFVSPTFRGREAAEEFRLQILDSVPDARIVTAEEGRALKRASLEGRGR
jgi:hypothetical protein